MRLRQKPNGNTTSAKKNPDLASSERPCRHPVNCHPEEAAEANQREAGSSLAGAGTRNRRLRRTGALKCLALFSLFLFAHAPGVVLVTTYESFESSERTASSLLSELLSGLALVLPDHALLMPASKTDQSILSPCAWPMAPKSVEVSGADVQAKCKPAQGRFPIPAYVPVQASHEVVLN